MTAEQAGPPPLGDIMEPDGICQYGGDCLGIERCDRPATVHLIFTDDLENGVGCSMHATEAALRAWTLAQHDLGTPCCAPGSIYSWELNVCVFPVDGDAPALNAYVTASAP